MNIFSKKIIPLLVIPFLINTANAQVQPKTSMSTHEAKCAIWLCLPAGFGQGCGQPYREFKKALKKGRNPLPSWSSCRDPRTPAAVAPYSMNYGYFTYINNGNGRVIERRGRNCPSTGIYSTEKTWEGDYRLTWATAICTTRYEFKTTFNDYIHVESSVGKSYEYTISNEFKPYVISRKRYYSH